MVGPLLGINASDRPSGAPSPAARGRRAICLPDWRVRRARPRGGARRLQPRRLSRLLPDRVPLSAGLPKQLRRLCPGR